MGEGCHASHQPSDASNPALELILETKFFRRYVLLLTSYNELWLGKAKQSENRQRAKPLGKYRIVQYWEDAGGFLKL